jgi:hypothetical protein
MSATKTPLPHTTHNTGFPPATSKARQQASFNGQTKVVTMKGSKLTERFDGTKWVVIKVDAA